MATNSRRTRTARGRRRLAATGRQAATAARPDGARYIRLRAVHSITHLDSITRGDIASGWPNLP